ncbi:MAG TPA: biopolymer transporter ExbD [Planctomycetota bacterium]|nr:biopolymer transporter ExbD [Planctomycetota bacterium]
MKLTKTKRVYGCEINIAPLIDVVFLLIIFFMTVSQFTRVEVEKITLPEAKKGETPPETPAGRIIINVLKDGAIRAGGREHTVESLGQFVTAELNGRPPRDVEVLIRADRDVPWDTAAQVLNVCARHNLSRVQVAVMEAKD